MFCHEMFILDIVLQITEKQQQNKSKQLFDVIIDGLEGLGQRSYQRWLNAALYVLKVR